jgi:hypothetical protein
MAKSQEPRAKDISPYLSGVEWLWLSLARLSAGLLELNQVSILCFLRNVTTRATVPAERSGWAFRAQKL